MFQRTTAINKILSLKKRIRGIQGGTSASKTYGILAILIDYCTKNISDGSIVSESIPHLKRGAIKDFKRIMRETGRWIDSGWHGTDFRYTFKNGSTIEFFSATEDSKLRGARRDWLYMNEANNLSFYAYTELVSRTKKFTFLDWNPTNSFWFHEEVLGDNDVDFLIINYLDNEACPESAREFIEKALEKSKTSKYWENWYRVYGLGEIGVLEGVIFNNWNTIDKIPNDAILESQGLDFGYTNDPTTLMQRYKWNNKYIFNEVIYQKGLTNAEIAKLIKANNCNNVLIYADSAEPKSIEELKRLGIKITGATKGADSIRIGIDTLLREGFLVTSSSVNYIKELRNYMWATDKEGKSLNIPIDAFNHCIDAKRYSMSDKQKPKFEFHVA